MSELYDSGKTEKMHFMDVLGKNDILNESEGQINMDEGFLDRLMHRNFEL